MAGHPIRRLSGVGYVDMDHQPANRTRLYDVRIEGKGSFRLPDGMTQEEADRLVREADARRQKEGR